MNRKISNDTVYEESTEDSDHDFDRYCNYPEISKPINKLGFSKYSTEDTEISSSNDVSSLSAYSLFSDGVSSVADRNYSISNVKLLPSSRTYTKLFDESSNVSSITSTEEECDEHVSIEEEFVEKCETEYWGIGGPFVNKLNDPTGWKKYSIVPDPWSTGDEAFSSIIDYDMFELTKEELSGVLTERIIASGSSKLGQLPDTKKFAITKLCLSKKQLKDISMLLKYRYFQYIDLSWNLLTSLKALNSSNYLMWLDVSHNQIKDTLDLKPPWFITYLNLSCNEIKVICDLSGFWSLRHLNLSWNLIEKIQYFEHLRYLRYLNLSNNQITMLEGLAHLAIEVLLLNNNRIYHYESNADHSLSTMENLAYLNLANNKISTLSIFMNVCKLKSLDLRNNCITELLDLEYLNDCLNIENIVLYGNEVTKWISYREFVIYKFKKLTYLDGLKVTNEEQVAAQIAFSNDTFIAAHQIRTRLTLLDQLSTKRITSDTLPYDQPLVPLVLFVGPPASGKKFIGRYLAMKFPKYVHWCTVYSTQPTSVLDMADEFWEKQKPEFSTIDHTTSDVNLVTMDTFNRMASLGEFLIVTELFGYKYGLCKDELAKCIIEDKICLTEMRLEDALGIKSHCLFPKLILFTTDNVELHTNRLRDMYNNVKITTADRERNIALSDQGKSNKESLYSDTEEVASNGKRPLTVCSSGITAVDIKLNIEQKFKERPDSVAYNKLYSQTEIPSQYTNIMTNTDSNACNLESVTSKDMHGQEKYNAVKFSPVIEGYSISNCPKSIEMSESTPTESQVSASNVTESDSFNEERSTVHSSVESKDSSLYINYCRPSTENSEWSWHLTPSQQETLELEIDEVELAIEQARKTFIRDGVSSAETYVRIHQENPGLFYDTVITDDLDKACAKVSTMLRTIYNERMTYVPPFEIEDDPLYDKIVGDRISCLMEEILSKKPRDF